MNDFSVQNRMRQIYAQRAALGGCGPYGVRGYGEDDYDDLLGSGVMVGGYGVPGQKNPASKIVGKYISSLTKKHPNWTKSQIMKGAWALAKKDPRYQKKYGSKVSATKTKKSGSKRAPQTKARHPKMTAAEKRAELGLTKKEWNALTSYQKTQIGKRFQERSARGKCRVPDFEGEYTLNRDYKCVKRKSKKKQL